MDIVSTEPVDTKPIKRLMWVIAGLVMLQPISAGFWLSGFEHASRMHAAGAIALQLVALIQWITALVLWLRRRVGAAVVGRCLGLLVIVVVEAWAGRHSEFWLHVPVGVALITWLRR